MPILWTEPASRRPPRRRLWPGVLIFLILTAIVASLGISTVVGWRLTHPDRLLPDQTPADHGLIFNDISFSSRGDGLQLKGWSIPSQVGGIIRPSKRQIIILHGYRENRLQLEADALGLAGHLAGRGFNVLMFDFRNSGLSDGRLTTVGLHEVNDFLGAVDHLKRNYSDHRLGVLGFSMGGAVAIMGAARESGIQAVVADSSFADLREYLEENLSVWSHLPHYPFTPLIMRITPLLTGFRAEMVSPLAEIVGFNRPVMFIHGEADLDIPPENSQRLLEAVGSARASLWRVPGAGHTRSHQARPDEYRTRVTAFFEENLR